MSSAPALEVAALEVSGLQKRFGGLPATRDVSLSVMPGERRLIIGPNGAGKTTLFNLITGDLTPDAGSGKLFGQELLKIPTQQRVHLGLARTYQILTLFPKETLTHNVVLALLGLDKMRWNVWTMLGRQSQLYDAAREALALVGLGDVAHRTVTETSYGERRRLEMAIECRLVCPHLFDMDQAGIEQILGIDIKQAALLGTARLDHSSHRRAGGGEVLRG